MTAQNQRDPDGTDILGQVRDGLADLKANVISRWGRVPHVAADPTTLADGMAWIRSDTAQLKWRANGVTYPTAWTAVTFQNSWANEGGTVQTVQYRKEGELVRLRGAMVAPGAPTSVAFTLPAGFRPPLLDRIPLIALSGGLSKQGRADMNTDGTLSMNNFAAADTVFVEFSFSTIS